MNEVEVILYAEISKTPILSKLEGKGMITLKHPLNYQHSLLRRILESPIGQTMTPKSQRETVKRLKEEFTHVQVTIKGIKELPTDLF